MTRLNYNQRQIKILHLFDRLFLFDSLINYISIVSIDGEHQGLT
jgi:hypothetical protein